MNTNDMTLAEAIQILVDIASRWGENTEENFARRIRADDTDAGCREIAIRSVDADESADIYFDDIIEVRNLWKAIEVAQQEINKPVEASPR